MERPYRSHLRPACIPCRRRKSRCQTEPSSDTCLMCRAHCTDCTFPASPKGSRALQTPQKGRGHSSKKSASSPSHTQTPRPIPAAIRKPTQTQEAIVEEPVLDQPGIGIPASTSKSSEWNLPQHTGRQEDISPLGLASNDDQQHNLHIVGPASTNDDRVLSDYLSAIPGMTRGTRMLIPVPANRSRPVLFTMVKKRPIGLPASRSPSAEKVDMIEKLLEPHTSKVIDLYFDMINICFPILDEASFRHQYSEDKSHISPALLACIYAHSMIYWRQSPALAPHRCPDDRFIWNLAAEACYSELYLSPGMSIIEAILLNVGGRPTTSLIGNGLLLGAAVSMAHSLGLNHNPLPWEIPESEKYLRMKIWWTLYVNDKWTSLAYGTPSQISATQYDVPSPALTFLCEEHVDDHRKRAASIFVALFGLTTVLDLHLQQIYHIGGNKEQEPANLELALNNWVESLDEDIRRIIIRGTCLDTPGSANLRLAYLTVRLLRQRIELEKCKEIFDLEDSRLLNRYIEARRISEEILLFTQELQPQHLGDFWMPVSAFAFPATVSFLLRCALETENSPAGLAQCSSFRVACELISALRLHKEKHDWDLGDICLAQHAEIVDKILAGVSAEQQGTTNEFDMQDFFMPDASIMDQFFPSLWDPLQNAW